jgi:hypothetical protein
MRESWGCGVWGGRGVEGGTEGATPSIPDTLSPTAFPTLFLRCSWTFATVDEMDRSDNDQYHLCQK